MKVLSEDERETDAEFVRLTKQKEELARKQKMLIDTIPTAMVMRDLLNDPTFIEAARKLAERMINEGGADVRGRITYGFGWPRHGNSAPTNSTFTATSSTIYSREQTARRPTMLS